MGGRGSSSGMSVKGKPYGTEYTTLYKSGNIKFVRYNDASSAKTPMETMTRGRVYVTVNGENNLVAITYHDNETRTIPSTDNGDGTITFASDKFSTFAVAFKDLEIKGNIENTTDKQNNVCGAQLNLPSDAIANKILTAEEFEQMANGQDVKVYLQVKDISSTASSADKDLINDAKGNSKVSMYLNIDLLKEVGSTQTKVTETNGKVKISLQIPSELINTNSSVTRTFSIIRIHNGVATVLDCTTIDSQTISFETDQFSTYALAYKDVKNSSSVTNPVSSTLKPVVNTSDK